MANVCQSCGARLRADADRCDLCGLPTGADPIKPEMEAAEPPKPDAPSVPVPLSSKEGADVSGEEGADVSGKEAADVSGKADADVAFCNACGHENPAGSRFCSQCGSKIQAAAAAKPADSPPEKGEPVQMNAESAPEPVEKPAPDPKNWQRLAEVGDEVPEASLGSTTDGALGKRVGIVFGAGLLVVIAFFMIQAVIGDDAPEPGPPSVATAPPPGLAPALPPEFEERANELRGQIDASEGAEKAELLRQLTDLYASTGRYDLAAGAAESLAQITGTEDDWTRAGNLHYDWMESLPAGPDQSASAKRAIAAYQEVVALNPNNLDVRTDLAVAYMYDPDNPMLAIQETAAVLQIDSTHVQANFNRAVMLMQINRLDAAAAQFRKVQRLVGDETDPVYQRAAEALASLQGGMPGGM